MKLLFVLMICFRTAAFSQPATIAWQQTFGGSDFEVPDAVITTSDGGCIIAGTSFSADGHVKGNHGIADGWIVKLHADKSIDWTRAYGGSADDNFSDIVQTTDGGFIIAGVTKSIDGDVTNLHGDSDAWIVKTNAKGIIQWQKTAGGSAQDAAAAVKQTADGGYIVCGYTMSNNGDVTFNHGSGTQDFWVIKLNAAGNIIWQKSYGGTDNEFAYDVEVTTNGYFLTGYARSANGDLNINKGNQDVWVLKIDNQGTVLSSLVVGGSGMEAGNRLVATPDGGCMIAAQSTSMSGDIMGNHGLSDAVIIKVSATGTKEWVRCYGGNNLEAARAILPSGDGNYFAICTTESFDGDVQGNHGRADYWLLKLDPTGNLLSQQTFGGSDIDECFAATTVNGNELIVAGTSFSNDKDVINSIGGGDYWIIKLSTKGPVPIIVEQPRDTALCDPGSAFFKLTATKTDTYQWQWLEGVTWTDLPDNSIYQGSKTNILLITKIAGKNTIRYRCVLTNAGGHVISREVILTVSSAPVFQAQPADNLACEGAVVRLLGEAPGATSWKWQQSTNNTAWTNIPNADSPYHIMHAEMLHNGTFFRCVASNDCGSTTSNAAKLTVYKCGVPNAFSPDNNGINDTWQIPFLTNFPNCRVSVFTRSGQPVFQSTGYRNPWNGTHNSNALPAGVYYYIISTEDKMPILKGSLLLLR